MRIVFVALAIFTLALGFYQVARAQTAPFYGCASCATAPPSTLPLVIPAAAIVQPSSSALPDPGYTPAQYLFQAYDWNQQQTNPAPWCQGVSPANCGAYKYQNFAQNPCVRAPERDVFNSLNASDETGFQHLYGGGITSGNRIVSPAFPSPTQCPLQPGGTLNSNVWNPNDFGLASAINTALGNTGSNYFPNGMFVGYFEDDTLSSGFTICGGGSSGAQFSAEFSSGWNSGHTQACNIPGTGPNAISGVDYLSAMGILASRLNKKVWYNGLFNATGDVGACSIIVSGHCHNQANPSLVDDAFVTHNICANAGGNNSYLLGENAIMHQYNGSTWPIANAQELLYIINSEANFENDSSCGSTKIVDEEYGYGTGGPGDLSGGITIRSIAAALRALVPNPLSGTWDKIIPEFVGITCSGLSKIENNPCSAGQVDGVYFWEETLVPYSPEISVPSFAWNGTTQSLGGGCDGTTDSGGAVALLIAGTCGSNTAGAYMQQYRNLFINGVSYGPAAAILNISGGTLNISSVWFKHDAISTYHYRMALSGGSLTSVPYSSAPGGVVNLACTYTTNCTGTTTVSSNMGSFAGDGTDTLCSPCGVILFANN